MIMKLLDLFYATDLVTPQPSRSNAVIALGGGGARGIAHLGVMQEVSRSQVIVDRIVGVSMGSLVGALFAHEPNVNRVKDQVIALVESPFFQSKCALLGGADCGSYQSEATDFGWYDRIKRYLSAHLQFSRAVTNASLVDESAFREIIDHLLPDIGIEDLTIPLSIVAVDLLSGHRVVLETGSLRQAVQASIAIPGIFPPVRWDNMLLCDIGVVHSVPTRLAKSYGAQLTIAVDVGQHHTAVERCDTAMDAMMRIQDIGETLLRREVLDVADITIRPDVGGVAWFDFSRPDQLIQEGQRAARRALSSHYSFSAKRDTS